MRQRWEAAVWWLWAAQWSAGREGSVAFVSLANPKWKSRSELDVCQELIEEGWWSSSLQLEEMWARAVQECRQPAHCMLAGACTRLTAPS
ncbi:hypothetical protein P171DRAFT_5670 [Karstenula rhodostoma CBS 690.94]|uniref:Secreted protein n=1 Tax=Karstenula rhodostoma CBS 690.94 TaxID=1392251 RepID=A0A9P4PU53_9PLEO|nr:hypothetical protein P171DRAFT_5670 [Karstenula rhodostoma CBS 690.94]